MYQMPLITLTLNCLTDFNSEELAHNFINIVNKYKEFIPTKYAPLEPLDNKYDKSDVTSIINTWMNMENRKENIDNNYLMGSLTMEKSSASKASYQISWEKTQQAQFNFMCFYVDLKYIQNKNFVKFTKICEEFIILFKPVQGQITNCMDKYSSDPMDLKLKHPELQWYNIFGKPYIDLFGKEKLLNTPCYKVHEIAEDIIVLQLMESVLDEVPNDEREKIKEYLGIESFVELGKSSRHYMNKGGIVPKFDFSEVIFDKNKPIEEPKILTREDVEKFNKDD